ncbi:hypothetical protein O6H91_16G021800 [Diphasiastrum complanatum]|uniref:Uncharacterized protein n=1 Tax=Diphasiastrum complanatum TaxID=34168 RepID=A0ACC2BAJ1_DIPCM|nr:hypothetical protein O6H91_16G021800 [Diphasiastrum complanatum]
MGILFLSSLLVMLLHSVEGIPLCLNSEAPFSVNSTLKFCSDPAYSSYGCCSQDRDAQLSQRFQSMNITNATCASLIQQVLCAECDAFSEDIFADSKRQSTPTLCDSGLSSDSSGYCSNLWQTCKDVPILNSPFSPYVVGPASPPPDGSMSVQKNIQDDTLTSQWESEQDFCTVLGAPQAVGNFCFSGTPFKFPPAGTDSPPQGICLDKVSSGSYIGMVPHPDLSNRIFLANQGGQVWLATVPKNGSLGPLAFNQSVPYLDISNVVVSDNELGLLGLAFHPNFLQNGRFFVSYNCDSQKSANCSGFCSCNIDVGCDPAQVSNGADSTACRYSSVIAEYSANGSSSPAQTIHANPVEVRRIFTMGLPFSTHHAGQIIFGPSDNYLYFMLGDGGSIGDPFNFSQNKKSLLGKILRLDIDKSPSTSEVSALGLLGNYSVPNSNPFTNDNNSRPEIWALGLRNPWRCSFDTLQPSYLYCADVGQDNYEEVNLITKGGNYGWHIYEGTNHYVPPSSTNQSNITDSITTIPPILQYSHASVNPIKNSAAIIGGYVSHSQEDACIYGRYLYADLFGAAMWAGVELPAGSGNYTTARINSTCSPSSPLSCDFVANSTLPNFALIQSWGQDNQNNVFILSRNGVFQMVSPSKCKFVCNKKISSTPGAPPPASRGKSIVPEATHLLLAWLTWTLLKTGMEL